MRFDVFLATFAVTLVAAPVSIVAQSTAPPVTHPLTRIAEVEVDPAHLAAYTAALKEEIEASIRLEPGVLTLYAVALREQPNQIRLFETYADQAAYESHRRSPQFLKYKAATQGMVKSLKLIEAEPILLGAKPAVQ